MNDEEFAKKASKKLKPPEPGADFGPVESTIFRRRSVRNFKKEQVPEYLVRRILETGRFAPSAGNCQPWKFIVVRDQTMIEEMSADIRKFCQRIMSAIYYVDPGTEWKRPIAKLFQRIRVHDLHPIPFGAMKLIADGKLGVWHGAPTVILILTDGRGAGCPELDAGIAGQNMVLTAHSLGLGSCWVSFVKPLKYNLKWRKRLGIRWPYKLLSSIAIGFPRGEPDGEVTRETKAIDWFENGAMKVVY